MEHSVEAYLTRLSAEEIKAIIAGCSECKEGKQYVHLLPLLRKILLSKEEKISPWR